MGAVIDAKHMQRVLGYIESGVAAGARLALGRSPGAARDAAASTSRRRCSMACARK